MLRSIGTAASGRVLRDELSAAGLARIAGGVGYSEAVSAELTDAGGEVCGRARRMADPAGGRYGPGMLWHVQLGGVLSSRVWAACPMGCGSGETLAAAVGAAVRDLRERAARMESAADGFGAMLSR